MRSDRAPPAADALAAVVLAAFQNTERLNSLRHWLYDGDRPRPDLRLGFYLLLARTCGSVAARLDAAARIFTSTWHAARECLHDTFRTDVTAWYLDPDVPGVDQTLRPQLWLLLVGIGWNAAEVVAEAERVAEARKRFEAILADRLSSWPPVCAAPVYN